ncbi:hypothetical protein V494_05803 [Pseudogymnoascus sp. VKM F-4513 (FW-928)]|nr:hypothetical protein V494_05803 [Pseudogymnoascus sp. VKM F-4513 (FW-928)]
MGIVDGKRVRFGMDDNEAHKLKTESSGAHQALAQSYISPTSAWIHGEHVPNVTQATQSSQSFQGSRICGAGTATPTKLARRSGERMSQC